MPHTIRTRSTALLLCLLSATPIWAAEQASAPTSALKNYSVDPYTGTANFTLPLVLPPAHSTIPFALNMVYSSRAGNGWLGVGWKLNLGMVERSTKNGFPAYAATDQFTFSLGEQQNDLVPIGGQEYRLKTADALWRIRFDGTIWTANDPRGNTYTFGLDQRLVDFSRTKDPASPSRIFRWRLSKISDTVGNSVIFKYLADRIEIYYTEKTEAAKGSFRPDDYNYAVTIRFLGNRADKLSNARPGFDDAYPLNGAGRIEDITVTYRGQLAKRYAFSYTASPATGRSQLDTVTEFGWDNQTSNPSVRFAYTKTSTPAILKYHDRAFAPGNGLWNIRAAELAPSLKAAAVASPEGVWLANGALLPPAWEPISTMASGQTPSVSWRTQHDSFHNGDLHLDVTGNRVVHAWTYIRDSTWQTTTRKFPVSGNCALTYYVTDLLRGISREGPYAIDRPLIFPGSETGQSVAIRLDLIGLSGANGCTVDYSVGEALFPLGMVDSGGSFPSISWVGDFNGDGLADVGYGATSQATVALSQASGFLKPASWLTGKTFSASSHIQVGAADMNGDGKSDLYFIDYDGSNHSTNVVSVMLSDGKKFVDGGVWSRIQVPTGVNGAVGYYAGDFTGDGLTDLLLLSGAPAKTDAQLAVNDGTRLVLQEKVALPNVQYTGLDIAVYASDFNGDGITDLGFWNNLTKVLDVRGWKNSWSASVRIDDALLVQKKAVLKSIQDVTGDGKADLLYAAPGGLHYVVSVWGTDGAGTARPFFLPLTAAPDVVANGFQTGDFNGDSRLDFIIYGDRTGNQVNYSNTDIPDLLNTVENGLGGSLNFSYESLVRYGRSSASSGPVMAIPLMSQLTTNDGLGHVGTTTYVYQDGVYALKSQEFRGFGSVLTIDARGGRTETKFLQDDVYKGRISQQQTTDQDGRLLSTSNNVWKNMSPTAAAGLIVLSETTRSIYDGDATFQQTRTAFQYDGYGNATQVSEVGDVRATGDERTTLTEYPVNTQRWLLNYPSHVRTQDATGAVLQERWFYYDDTVASTTPPTKGLLTKEEQWWFRPGTRGSTRITRQFSYDGFGNVTKSVDPLNHSMMTEYDPDLHLYPITVTNALKQVVRATYDPKTGRKLSITDANQQRTTYFYDAVGRIRAVYEPDDGPRSPGVTYDYDFSTCPLKTTVKTKTSYDSQRPGSVSSYSFYDGLGRMIQRQSLAEPDPQSGALRYVVSDAVLYGGQGEIQEKYLPYFKFGAPGTYASDASAQPHLTYQYDAAGRLTRLTNADQTFTETRYNDWSTTHIDENGHSTIESRDAYGNVVRVEELNGPDRYTTTYVYDGLSRLMKITDHQLNVTSFVYDTLGRRIRMQDVDRGVMSYDHDAAGNLRTQKDARNKTIELMYDDLNRVTIKRTGAQTLATYVYDDPATPYGLGRLCKVTDAAGANTMTYDQLGRVRKTVRTVGGRAFEIERVYDAVNRLEKLRYPTGTWVTYTYNGSGQRETVKEGEFTVVAQVDYTPSGQIGFIHYGNGDRTTYTYDPLSLRLKRIAATGAFGTVQDLSYGFDDTGNVRTIADAAAGTSQTFRYDDLDRLTSAQGPYGTLSYRYDALGGFHEKEGVQYAYNPARPHAVVFTSEGLRYEYDESGNLRRQLARAQTDEFFYDDEGRVSSATKRRPASAPIPTSSTSFVYDAGGERIKKTVDGRSTVYIDGIYERDSNGQERSHVFLGAARIYTRASAVVILSASGTPQPSAAALSPATYTLSVSPATAKPGDTLTVNWTAPAGHSTTDWIALYKPGTGSAGYLLPYRYLPSGTSGTLTFTAPAAGTYEVRAYPNNGYDPLLATSNAVIVGLPPTGEVPGAGITLTLTPSLVMPNQTVTVAWTLPKSPSLSEWIGIYSEGQTDWRQYLIRIYPGADPAHVIPVPQPPSGSKNIAMPQTPGRYIARYFLNESYAAQAVAMSNVVTVSLVSAPPAVRLVAPVAGARYTVPATVSLTAEASDPDGTIAKVEFFNGIARLGQDTTAPYEYVWPNMPLGTYTVTAKATDNAGQTTTSAAVTFTVAVAASDSTPPQVAILSPGNQSTVSGSVVVDVSASDNVGVTDVRWLVDGQLVSTASTPPYRYAWNTLLASPGLHTLTVTARDAAGNATSASVQVTVSNTATTLPSGCMFYHTDHLGSSSVVTDNLGRIIQRASYRPFGGFAKTALDPYAPNPSVRHYFTGHELDFSTDLYFAGARYYSSKAGRFTQPDPLIQNVYDPQTLNPYTYVRNNPLRLVDPNGLAWQDAWGSMSFSMPSNPLGSWLGGSFNLGTTFSMQVFSPPQISIPTIPFPSPFPMPIPGPGPQMPSPWPNPWPLPGPWSKPGGGWGDVVYANGSGGGGFDSDWSVPDTRSWTEKLGAGHYFGTTLGQQAKDWYAQRKLETGNLLWTIPEKIAGRWTPETYQKTGWTLVAPMVAQETFRKGGWLNSNPYLRIGMGRHEGSVFRITGEWVKQLTGREHIDLWHWGP